MYGQKKVKFTLEEFETMNRNKERLKVYRQKLGTLHKDLTIQIKKYDKAERAYVPTTFDSMMTDFGHREERKRLWNDLSNSYSDFLVSLPGEPAKIKSQLREQAESINEIFKTNNQTNKLMASLENVLFRKIMCRAQRENSDRELQEQKLTRAKTSLSKEKSLNQAIFDNSSEDDLVLIDPVKQAKKEVKDFIQSVDSTRKSMHRKSSLKSSIAYGEMPNRLPVLFNTGESQSSDRSFILRPQKQTPPRHITKKATFANKSDINPYLPYLP